MSTKDKKRRVPGRSTLTTAKLAVFLKTLSESPNVTAACDAANLDLQFMYKARDLNPELKQQWEQAIDRGYESLEAEMGRRAHRGTKKGVYYKGELVGYEKVYSDVLAMFLLKGARPDRYRERVSHEGKNGGPISFVIEGDKD